MISNDDENKTFGHNICFDIKLSSKNLCTFFLAVIYFFITNQNFVYWCAALSGTVRYSMLIVQ